MRKYFPLPNVIFHLGLSAGEIAVYAFLMYCEDRKTFQCYPSYKTISKALQLSSNTVRKYVAELERKQLITTERTTITTKAGKKRNGSLLYTIRPIEEAVHYHFEMQMQNAREEQERVYVQKRLEEFERKHSRVS